MLPYILDWFVKKISSANIYPRMDAAAFLASDCFTQP